MQNNLNQINALIELILSSTYAFAKYPLACSSAKINEEKRDSTLCNANRSIWSTLFIIMDMMVSSSVYIHTHTRANA